MAHPHRPRSPTEGATETSLPRRHGFFVEGLSDPESTDSEDFDVTSPRTSHPYGPYSHTTKKSYSGPPTPKVIASYGLILFFRSEGGEPKFLIYQRRDTYDYIDLLRGLWSNEYRLREMCCSLTPEEKDRIRRYNFRELWDDLWIVHGSHIHTEGYERAYRKFETSRSTILASINLEVSVSPPYPPWGFPKGKRNSHEKEFDCAVREFIEETNLDLHDMAVIPGKTFQESHRGSNGKYYSTQYFLAEVPSELPIQKFRTPEGCIRKWAVSPESADLRWVSADDCFDLLDLRKADILRKADEFVRSLPPFSTSTFRVGISTPAPKKTFSVEKLENRPARGSNSGVSGAEINPGSRRESENGTFRYTKLSEIPEFHPRKKPPKGR